MSRSKTKDPQLFGDLATKLARRQGWQEQLDLHSLFLTWPELVDADTAAHAQPLKIERRVLWLEVENSAWLQQLQYQTSVLLEILNKSLKRSKLDGIRLVLVDQVRKKAEPKKAKVRYVRPPVEEQEAFQRHLLTIEDEKIREALMRYWYLAHACQRVE